MFKYFPHTEEDIKLMLERIGLDSLDDLFSIVPDEIKKNASYNLDDGLSECELLQNLNQLSGKNPQLKIFRGAGAYDHHTPSVIPYLTSRSEFLTSYTPYQPEISQGTLQYIFEYQSYICELTGMDVSNASMYDGATSTAEAMLMATSQMRKNKILISKTVHPHTIEVVKTYAHFRNIEVIVLEEMNGYTQLEEVKKHKDYAALIVQNPNYYGLIEDYQGFSDVLQDNKALFIYNADPQTLGILKTPRDYGADIAVGDIQTLGIPLSFGGAYGGYLATTQKLLRKMPGRICGVTNDLDGKRAFVLTLQAREQHIRREKANSNICSNQSLMALWVTIYLSIMGKDGLEKVNEKSYVNAHYLYHKLLETKHFKKVYDGHFIKEFVLEALFDVEKVEKHMIEHGYLFGLPLEGNRVMFAVTEKYNKQIIDEFVEVLNNVLL